MYAQGALCMRAPALIAVPPTRISLAEFIAGVRNSLGSDSVTRFYLCGASVALDLAQVLPTERFAAYAAALDIAEERNAALWLKSHLVKLAAEAAKRPAAKKEPCFLLLPERAAFGSARGDVFDDVPPAFHTCWSPEYDLWEFSRRSQHRCHTETFARCWHGLEPERYREAAMAAAIAMGQKELEAKLGPPDAAIASWRFSEIFQVFGALLDHSRYKTYLALLPPAERRVAAVRAGAGAYSCGAGDDRESFIKMVEKSVGLCGQLFAGTMHKVVERIGDFSQSRSLVRDKTAAHAFSHLCGDSKLIMIRHRLVDGPWLVDLLFPAHARVGNHLLIKMLPHITYTDAIGRIMDQLSSKREDGSLLASEKSRGLFQMLNLGAGASRALFDSLDIFYDNAPEFYCALFESLRLGCVLEHEDALNRLLARCIPKLQKNSSLIRNVRNYLGNLEQCRAFLGEPDIPIDSQTCGRIFAFGATLCAMNQKPSYRLFAALYDAAAREGVFQNAAGREYMYAEVLKAGSFEAFALLRTLLPLPVFSAQKLIEIFTEAFGYRYMRPWPKALLQGVATELGPNGAWAAATVEIEAKMQESLRLRTFIQCQLNSVDFCTEFADLFVSAFTPETELNIFQSILANGAGRAAEYFWRRLSLPARKTLSEIEYFSVHWTPKLLQFCRRHAAEPAVAHLLKLAHVLVVAASHLDRTVRYSMFIKECAEGTNYWKLTPSAVEWYLQHAFSAKDWELAQKIADSGLVSPTVLAEIRKLR